MKYEHKWFNVSGVNGSLEQQDRYMRNYEQIDWSDDGRAPPTAQNEDLAPPGQPTGQPQGAAGSKIGE